MEGRVPRPGPGRSATVLVVDDQIIVLDIARQLLESAGYSVHIAPGGRDALRIYEERADDIDCVLLDLEMPGMNGIDTYHGLRGIRDDVRVIFSSGFDRDHVMSQLPGQDGVGFVQKPYRLRTLEAAVEQAVGVAGPLLREPPSR